MCKHVRVSESSRHLYLGPLGARRPFLKDNITILQYCRGLTVTDKPPVKTLPELPRKNSLPSFSYTELSRTPSSYGPQTVVEDLSIRVKNLYETQGCRDVEGRSTDEMDLTVRESTLRCLYSGPRVLLFRNQLENDIYTGENVQ